MGAGLGCGNATGSITLAHTSTYYYRKIESARGQLFGAAVSYLAQQYHSVLKQAKVQAKGRHRRLTDAIGLMEKRKLGAVPSFVHDWRARRDSNPRPLASEANTLIR